MKDTNRNNTNDTVLFVNENGIGQLCLEIGRWSDNIALIFNRIDDEMDSLKDYYKSDSSKELKTYYDDLRKNYENIKYNINSYSDDLASLVIKVKSGIKDIALSIRTETEDIKAKVKTIEDRRS